MSEITKNAYKVFSKCQKGVKVNKLAKNHDLLNQFLEKAVKQITATQKYFIKFDEIFKKTGKLLSVYEL